MHDASTIRVAAALYSTIADSEEPLLSAEAKHRLSVAEAIFDHLLRQHGDMVGFDPDMVLPQTLVSGMDPEELRQLFSVLRN
jgi:hypothetical protein